MAVQANKWVAAAVAALKWSELVDIQDANAVAALCDFFGFNVAHLWIATHPETYEIALRDGFDATLTQDDKDHAEMHIAMVLSMRGSELAADAKVAQRVAEIIAEKLPETPRPAPRKNVPANMGLTPGLLATS